MLTSKTSWANHRMPNPSVDQKPRTLTFGDAVWDRAERRLIVRGELVKLNWRVAECLNILIEAGGEVVTKEDLQRQIWGGALVEESNVPRCVVAIRKVLDPAPDGGSYIETVARMGYRLAVSVRTEPATQEPPAQTAPVRRRPRYALAAGLVLSSVLAAGGFLGYRKYQRLEQVNELLGEAWSLMRRGGLQEGDQAAGLIQRAIDLVPGHPPAQAALAELAARQGMSSFGAAVELARMSVTSDPSCADCHAVLGYVLGTRAWRWEEARRHLERALALDPKNVYARIWYAEWLAIHNRLDEALEQAKQVRALAPAELHGLSTMAFVNYFQGRYKDTLTETEKANGMNRWFQPAHYWAYRSYMQIGDDYNAIMERGME